jgi:outer membrane lipoprotein-sorting protein
MSSLEKIKKLFAKSTITVSSKVDDRIMSDALVALDASEKDESISTGLHLWRIIMKVRITRLAVAAAILIAVLVGIHWLGGSIYGTGRAFGDVLDTIARVQTLHARWIVNGQECEVWAKRPNRIRLDHTNGKYEISNGPTMWVVDEPNDKATQKPSPYFKEAQRRGIDVLDGLVRMEYTDNFSGFFSESPSGQVEEGDKTFDLYQMEFDDHGYKIQFEALVAPETHLIHQMKVGIYEAEKLSQSYELSIMDYDQSIPDTMFIFEPAEGMHISVEESEDSGPVSGDAKGSILSGRIIWESKQKPVSGARLTFWGGPSVRTPEGGSKSSFFVRAETDNNGYWKITGAPPGGIRMTVRSWEFEWPAMPTFTTNVGSPLYPIVKVDGQSEYTGLNFKVYKPKDLYARITINVKDEDGHPVEGAAALLYYADESWDMHQHVYATPRKSQFSRADGKFDNSDIWPSVRPVKLSVGPRNADCPYPIRSTFTEPFIIEPKEHYHFDIVLPYKREMTVKVVDPDHKPLEGVYVSVLDQQAAPIYPWLDSNIVLTNSDGLADVTGMFPGEKVIIALKRLDIREPDPWKPLAFACVPAIAPQSRNKPIVEVVFDERQIVIQGRLVLDSKPDSAVIFLMITGERGDSSSMVVLSAKVDENGKFLLQGVPVGKIRIAYSARFGKQDKRDEGVMVTEPGNNYTVDFTEQGLQIAD